MNSFIVWYVNENVLMKLESKKMNVTNFFTLYAQAANTSKEMKRSWYMFFGKKSFKEKKLSFYFSTSMNLKLSLFDNF